jgi:hypothetical protein
LFLAAVIVVAILITLAVVALGAFLIIFPIVLIVGALAWLLAYLRGGRAPERDRRVIETDYRVIEQERIERKRKRD